MNLQDIREQMWQDESLFEYFRTILFPDGIAFCNPDFLVSMDETQARAGKVFDDDSVDFPTEQDCIDASVLALKKVAEDTIRASCATLMQSVAKPYSAEERETWFKQQAGAEAYSADETVTTFIQKMADAREISVSALITKIQENIDLYDVAIATILGQQQKAIDELG